MKHKKGVLEVNIQKFEKKHYIELIKYNFKVLTTNIF